MQFKEHIKKQNLERRGRANRGTKSRRLSRLLRCQCGKTLWAQITPEGKYWRCSSIQKGHTYINDNKALAIVIPEIVESIRNANTIKLPQQKDTTAEHKAALKDLKQRKKRWDDAYEAGKLELDTYNDRIHAINTRLKHTEDLLAKTQAAATRQQNTTNTLTQLKRIVNNLQEYYLTAPPEQVNADLHTFIEHITITKAHKVKIKWR